VKHKKIILDVSRYVTAGAEKLLGDNMRISELRATTLDLYSTKRKFQAL